MPISLHHLSAGAVSRWAVCDDGEWAELDGTLADLLALPLDKARAMFERAVPTTRGGTPSLAPVDRQEIWAAGVTYLRSRDGRREESGHASVYDHVYDSARPEIFFKASPWRVVGDGEAVGIRADSGWDVPEAEVGLVINAFGEIFGYLLGNDMSSRSIEGENPLYLPQAKIYDRCCALGPAVVPSWAVGPGPFEITLRVLRKGIEVYAGTTSTSAMARTFDDLARWLFRALSFPHGVVLLTGTWLVPDADFTTRAGDTIEITSPALGSLINYVVEVGTSMNALPGTRRQSE